MIPAPSGVRVWLSVGRTDMRRGMNGLALRVQEALGRDPHGGDLYVVRDARGDLIKILWHDVQGMSLYAKRLEKGRFIWPSPADGVVGIPVPPQHKSLTEQASGSAPLGAMIATRRSGERQFARLPAKSRIAGMLPATLMMVSPLPLPGRMSICRCWARRRAGEAPSPHPAPRSRHRQDHAARRPRSPARRGHPRR